MFKEADGTEFRFSYFPSLDQLRLLVLRSPREFTNWEITLRREGKSDALMHGAGTLPMPAAGETLKTPSLDDGTYELTFTLVAAGGKRRDIRRTFQREHFPWEHTSLGRDRVVIPPFTPLVVDERRSTVACVLRKHELDGAGLWKQVSSEDRPLLTSPMRLEIESAGKTYTAKGQAVAFTEKAADRVRGGTSSWAAGPVQGSTEFEFDYDGLTKITLHLQPTTDRIDAMQLVIPVKTGEAWLMHPVTDLLRFHYAGRIPKGKGKVWDADGKMSDVRYTDTGEPDANGKVWDSRHVSRFQLPGPFVPYIWLGGTERGICWFAESDRDWSLDPTRPAMEIRRQGETTSLIVRLVTKPVTFTRPRTIAFGLMATPAKPMPETPVSFRRHAVIVEKDVPAGSTWMPETPVSFRRWWPPVSSNRKTSDIAQFVLMGACYYWGAASPCHSFWPVDKNFSLYDEFVRLRKGGKINPMFIDKWLAQFTPENLRLAQQADLEAELGPFKPGLATYRAHVNWSFSLFAAANTRPEIGQSLYAIPYTNARCAGSGEEVRTFMDEWSTCDIADPRWPGEERFLREKKGGYKLATYGPKIIEPNQAVGVAYAVDPVPSWQDMVLSYCKRMLETFADGIYFDNYFLSPNENPLGPGYVDDEGKLHAGVNIYAFHDLAKRVAVMQHRMGKQPVLFIHMTNANIVPMLSFGTMILDHEWRDQGDWVHKDSQERLGLDDDTSLLLAESTGLQSGCLAVYHDLFHGDERLGRSALGVALTHEMKFKRGWWLPGDVAAAQLSDFGYGLRDCRVWRYWDESQPIKTTGAAVKTLVLARGGKAMVVVASYGPGGDVQLDCNRRELGLVGDLVAVNVETGKPIEQELSGGFKLLVPRHDFRVLRVEPPEASK